MDAVALYEMFGSTPAQMILYDEDRQAITTVSDAIKHKYAIFGSFFDMSSVERVCDDHGLEFSHRMAITPFGVARVYGSVKDSVRVSMSAYEQRKKSKTHSAASEDIQSTVADLEKKIGKAETYLKIFEIIASRSFATAKGSSQDFRRGKEDYG
ncbi:uncharacterized protein BYT42DRAFT_199678 [Radiomyces spectabilis]|uniref:uncharacterized protein n=1 Tax=Radiomyces spectabilis TaxID=64574 RepID=UPI00221E64A8|nr:uncharacterized protein BYT42DRAFT_199678 [Radiomyces spectabilis]KAI8391562.1 hypothetical protein BYT42DRAFT_199678 [Radiomyces spectabilis]